MFTYCNNSSFILQPIKVKGLIEDRKELVKTENQLSKMATRSLHLAVNTRDLMTMLDLNLLMKMSQK